jgi:hypothetical protein
MTVRPLIASDHPVRKDHDELHPGVYYLRRHPSSLEFLAADQSDYSIYHQWSWLDN